MNKLLIIAGPSAVGKTTVMKRMLEISDSFEYLRSATTRAPRGDGNDSEYLYLSRDEFLARVDSHGMLEYTEYGGNLYGTPMSEIERAYSLGKTPLLILDINGVTSVKAAKLSVLPLAVYITAPLDVLDARLRERAEKDGNSEGAVSTLEKRKAQNRLDLENFDEISKVFDLVVENKDINETAREIIGFFEKH
jgi:guanylate kinase